jgi:hypothetical protein
MSVGLNNSSGGLMPRFFFDLEDDGSLFADEEGEELPSTDVAHTEALSTLCGIVKDNLPSGKERKFVIRVRGETIDVVLVASMTLCVERKG